MGYGTSLGTAHEDEISSVLEPLTAKELSDRKEINANETSGDFQSRFGGIDIRPVNASTMPLEASRKLTDAFKQSGGTEVPGNEPETNLPDIKDVQPTFAEDIFGKGEHDIRPALGHFYETVKNAFKLPGDVYSGKVPAGSIQEIERATDLAGLMITGPAPVARGMADGSLGSFMGVQSKTIDKTRLYKAQDMEMNAFHPEDIWNETQTFRGADNRWRQVILDKEASLKKEGLEVTPGTPPGTWTKLGKGVEPEKVGVPDRFKNLPETNNLQAMYDYLVHGPGKHVLLGDVLHHPELYRAYPWLKNVHISPMPEYHKGYLGMAKDNDIWMSAAPEKEFRSTLMHEIQHIIQDREGFARGGNPEMFLPQALKPAEENFLKIRAEAEGDIIKTYGFTAEDIRTIKQHIYDESQGIEPSKHWKELKYKLKDKGIYQPLVNITKSEELLSIAQTKAFNKYQRIMGEVESRNVQARLDFDRVSNAIHSPRRTESMVIPRSEQINPKDIVGYINTRNGSASEPIPFRRAANDNKDLQIRNPEMDDVIDANWKTLGELQRIQAEEEKLLFSGKNDEFTIAKIKKLQKEYQDLYKGK